jgi:hypothetical protein
MEIVLPPLRTSSNEQELEEIFLATATFGFEWIRHSIALHGIALRMFDHFILNAYTGT